MDKPTLTPEERAALRAWHGADAPEPDDLALAAWLEGRLVDAGETARVETWLARDAARLDALAAALTAAPEAVPEAELERAARLVTPPAAGRRTGAAAWPVRLLGGSLGLAGAAAGLAVGLALGHWHSLVEASQMAALLGDLAGVGLGAW
ncbi:hypothetical protein EZJ19_15465 [Parasulfuritortus cantonensis]|uniref:Uncharacterized protein n=1 Tax=Parasulfuritortus cantonensis TaxID=2528202 RepID=A0A4R1B7G0_9PROT|nr:hypothetical protein [Parasulfuritortus cantonensis]TCJ11549.1 hypothetical protein EZJ19_15465 [Parasulfuritortus cantonensis]